MNIHQKMIYKVAKLTYKLALLHSNTNMSFKKHYKKIKIKYRYFSMDKLKNQLITANGSKRIYANCNNCIKSKSLFYTNTGTCEDYMYLGECNFKGYDKFEKNAKEVFVMIAKDMFEKLGYEQKENSNEGIQYVKRAKDSELQRIGMISTKYIEFYRSSKEIVVNTIYEHRSGRTSTSDSGILNIEEFNAVQNQVVELGW